MDTETQKIAAAEAKVKAEIEAADEQARADEQKRLGELKAAFPDDLEFAVKAYGEGKSVLEARAEYCDVLQKQIKEAADKMVKVEVTKKVAGAEAISTESSDNETEGGFLAEAQQMVDDGKAKNRTEAMRKLARSNPALHETYKKQCEIAGKAGYGEVAAA